MIKSRLPHRRLKFESLEERRLLAADLVDIDIHAPHSGDVVGIESRGWFVDLEIEFETDLSATGAELQITGPAGHNNIAPLPGTFSPGADDRLPGLVVLLSTTSVAAGPGTNLANLFNLTGITDRGDGRSEIWDTWIVGAPNFGRDTDSTLYVAVVDDLDGNGVYDDAPNVVPDADGDGDVDAKDLKAIGLASNVKKVKFFISDAPAVAPLSASAVDDAFATGSSRSHQHLSLELDNPHSQELDNPSPLLEDLMPLESDEPSSESRRGRDLHVAEDEDLIPIIDDDIIEDLLL